MKKDKTIDSKTKAFAYGKRLEKRYYELKRGGVRRAAADGELLARMDRILAKIGPLPSPIKEVAFLQEVLRYNRSLERVDLAA